MPPKQPVAADGPLRGPPLNRSVMPLSLFTIMNTLRLITIILVGVSLCANVSVAQRKRPQKSSATAIVPNAQTEWKTAASNETYKIEFSPKRLTRISPTIIRVWTRRHSLPKTSDTGLTMSLKEYNCRTRASRSVKTVMYDAAGKMLITELTSELYSTPNAEWEFVIPNTLGEDELDTICKFRR